MLEIISNYIDSIASVIAVLAGVYGMLKLIFDPKIELINHRLDSLEMGNKEILDEMQKFHTRLTWLDGYISHRDHTPRRKKGSSEI